MDRKNWIAKNGSQKMMQKPQPSLFWGETVGKKSRRGISVSIT